MDERIFVDHKGTRWSVRATFPTMTERRRREWREAVQSAFPGGPDRRVSRERRRRAEVRAPVTPGFEHGWLTFESSIEKRRIAPIPPHWQDVPDLELIRLCARALGVPKWRGRLIE